MPYGPLPGTFEPASPGHAGPDRGHHGPSRFAQAPRRTQAAPLQSPEQPDTQSGAQFTPPARGPHNEDGEVQSSSRQQANSAEPAVSAGGTSERRAIVDRECARLKQEGAPEGTRWAVPCSCLLPWSCIPCPALPKGIRWALPYDCLCSALHITVQPRPPRRLPLPHAQPGAPSHGVRTRPLAPNCCYPYMV